MVSQLKRHRRITPMEPKVPTKETLNSKKRYGQCITRKMTAEDWEKYGPYNPVPKHHTYNHYLQGKPKQDLVHN